VVFSIPVVKIEIMIGVYLYIKTNHPDYFRRFFEIMIDTPALRIKMFLHTMFNHNQTLRKIENNK